MKNGLEDTVSLISNYRKIHKSFLPKKTPLYTLPKPYDLITKACDELPMNYHGENKNCRIWLNNIFFEVSIDWISALEYLSNHQLESLMTKVSLLCHAYRWKCMPALPEEYQIKYIKLPDNLELLWKELSLKLKIPMVGNFYTMVSNNWYHKELSENSFYNVEDISEEKIEVMHTWLLEPLNSELKAFIMAALGMEAQGYNVIKGIELTYIGILENNISIIAEGLSIIECSTKKIITFFNKSIKLRLIQSTNFLKYIQPTMIWLIDGIEGANGTQCCTIQILDSFLGVKRNSAIGKMIKRSKEYMLPEHIKLLDSIENTSDILSNFMKENNNENLNILYQNCIKGLVEWRNSHKNRGARYLKGEENEPIEHYVSTGLAVPLSTNREKVFKDLMESHIIETKKQIII